MFNEPLNRAGSRPVNEVFGDRLSLKQAATTIALAVVCAAAALALYYMVPLIPRAHEAIWWRLAVVLAIFIAVVSHEIRAILHHAYPGRRAVVALAVVLPLFVVLFSWLYLVVSRSNPAAFGVEFSRTEALYFAITVLSTVGFGEITPKTDPARLLVAAQMVSDLVLLAIVVKLILGTASRTHEYRGTPTAPEQSE